MLDHCSSQYAVEIETMLHWIKRASRLEYVGNFEDMESFCKLMPTLLYETCLVGSANKS